MLPVQDRCAVLGQSPEFLREDPWTKVMTKVKLDQQEYALTMPWHEGGVRTSV